MALEGISLPLRSVLAVGEAMRRLVSAQLDITPFPGEGNTFERWRVLAAVAARDLCLAKIYEGHTDALAILHELGAPPLPGVWAVWAAESPQNRVVFHPSGNGGAVRGRKSWCSGARIADYALITVWTDERERVLVRVAMNAPGISIDSSGWQAVGMAASASETVDFQDTPAVPIDQRGEYLSRPGFWQGGAGIAAVWYGAAAAIAETLAASSGPSRDPHAAAHLGAIDIALSSSRSLLREAAAWIDAHPSEDASAWALRVRGSVESVAEQVLQKTGRALGPTPQCRDARHAHLCSDLPIFLRQSHAEHDLAALGESAARDRPSWAL